MPASGCMGYSPVLRRLRGDVRGAVAATNNCRNEGLCLNLATKIFGQAACDICVPAVQTLRLHEVKT